MFVGFSQKQGCKRRKLVVAFIGKASIMHTEIDKDLTSGAKAPEAAGMLQWKGEIIMLRKFIQCANINERLAMVSDENAGEWTTEELKAVMEIVGASSDKADTREAMLAAIVGALGENAKEVLSDEFVSRARELTDSIPGAEELPEREYADLMREFCQRLAAQQRAAGR